MKRIWGAAGLGAISLFMLLGFLSGDQALFAPATLAALGLTVALPAVGAGLLVRGHMAERNRLTGRKAMLRQQTIEAEVLRLAAEHRGRLTAVEVATLLAVTPESATETLNALAAREHAELEITDAGLIVYNFHDVRHLGDKHSARGILDA